jgi:pimeloyl-ACP methyl ester carboxylesterase
MAVPAGSGERLVDVGGSIRLCCEGFGDPADPPLVLIMGLGRQLVAWPQALCERLSERGYHVVRFDNRDIGRSTHVSTLAPTTAQLITRRFDPDQYTLADMARDTAGLIDALGLRPAHVVGVSMGGMIGQTLAARHPQHVRSLVSIMSTTGRAGVGWAAPSTLAMMFRSPPRDREQALARAAAMWRHIGSHGFPFDEQASRDLVSRELDRDRRTLAGTARQLAAVIKSGDRTAELETITAPTLVLHGDRDQMVHPSGGRATAAAIPGARLETIAGMGHDLPSGLLPRLVELVADHAVRADRSTSAGTGTADTGGGSVASDASRAAAA